MAEYIDRTALRDALYEADGITMNGLKILNQFPSADVVEGEKYRGIIKAVNEMLTQIHKNIKERNTGKWQLWKQDKPPCKWYSCDVCGYHSLIDSPYCPNCGAGLVEDGKL